MHVESGHNLDVALDLARTAVSVAPDVPEVLDTLGWVYYKKQLPNLAVPLFERCVERAPTNASYHHRLGLAYMQAKDTARGRAAIERALALGLDRSAASDARRVLAEIQ
jgi:Flp pilus assembly protein TadD